MQIARSAAALCRSAKTESLDARLCARQLPCLTPGVPNGQKHHERDEYDHERRAELIGSHDASSFTAMQRESLPWFPRVLAPVRPHTLD